MDIAAILPEEAVLPEVEAATRMEMLAGLVEILVSLYPKISRDSLLSALYEREKLGSTAVGHGVAIPHCKVAGLDKVILAVGRSLNGVECDAPDNKPCHIFFLLLAPEGGAEQHLRLLAQISRRAKDPIFLSNVMLAQNREQLRRALLSP